MPATSSATSVKGGRGRENESNKEEEEEEEEGMRSRFERTKLEDSTAMVRSRALAEGEGADSSPFRRVEGRLVNASGRRSLTSNRIAPHRGKIRGERLM